MTYDREVLADQPIARLDAAVLPKWRQEPYAPDHLWTLERLGEFSVHAVVTTSGTVKSAYVNGEPVEHDHPLIVELTDGWNPPLRWLVTSETMTCEAALYDRALTEDERLALWDLARQTDG